VATRNKPRARSACSHKPLLNLPSIVTGRYAHLCVGVGLTSNVASATADPAARCHQHKRFRQSPNFSEYQGA
jgi:hypothetical protein